MRCAITSLRKDEPSRIRARRCGPSDGGTIRTLWPQFRLFLNLPEAAETKANSCVPWFEPRPHIGNQPTPGTPSELESSSAPPTALRENRLQPGFPISAERPVLAWSCTRSRRSILSETPVENPPPAGAGLVEPCSREMQVKHAVHPERLVEPPAST